jgi:SAM-dependent methyltransferase
LNQVERLYEERHGRNWRDRLRRLLVPPVPYIRNSSEPTGFPLGRWNLYIGGGGTLTPGYINIDLFPLPGVDVAADAERLPFRDAAFQRIECDAVLEHVRNAGPVMREIERVTSSGGYVHLVTPFCHPFHEYPRDYRRFTIDGLAELARDGFEVVDSGWRTGPTATLLVVVLEWLKMLLPWRWWRAFAHGFFGWLLFPLRYLDLLLLRSPYAGRIGNHCYIWLRRR